MSMSRGRPLLADVVRSELKRLILGGEFAVGSKLPNEDRLCERFGVSRVTIREAVRGLIEDGLVVRRHGSGTYVTRRPLIRNSLDMNFSYTDHFQASGFRPGRKLLGVRRIAADEELAADLAIPAGSTIVEIRRIRTADGRPAIYSIDRVPDAFVDASVERSELGGSLYRILTAAGHPIAHAEAVLTPTVADKELARLLDVAPGTPIQHLRQSDFDDSGQAVMVSDEWHVTSVIELRVYRRGPGPVG
ncbi:MAG: GntR family transcriptional regulator [Chloroflexota bacterium]|jgi:DNA-binding GntR family transcriptional regulator|nr:GntR family transcriptional regulator [Chloroflexota bacterium]